MLDGFWHNLWMKDSLEDALVTLFINKWRDVECVVFNNLGFLTRIFPSFLYFLTVRRIIFCLYNKLIIYFFLNFQISLNRCFSLSFPLVLWDQIPSKFLLQLLYFLVVFNGWVIDKLIFILFDLFCLKIIFDVTHGTS